MHVYVIPACAGNSRNDSQNRTEVKRHIIIIMDSTMSTKLLAETGTALYGQQWQSQLARDLDMSDRHMRRLVSGEAKISQGMIADLCHIALERAADLDSIIERLKIAATPGNDERHDRQS